MPHPRPAKQRPEEEIEFEQDHDHQPRAAHPPQHHLRGRPQRVDRLMMPAFRAMKLKDRAIFAAVLWQSVKAVAATLAKNRQFLAKRRALWRSKVSFVENHCHLSKESTLNVQRSIERWKLD